jgi:hypothetical protein
MKRIPKDKLYTIPVHTLFPLNKEEIAWVKKNNKRVKAKWAKAKNKRKRKKVNLCS